MNSQELIQLHALLYEVKHYLEAHDSITPYRFTEYEAQSVRPASVHRRKLAHRDAIRMLLRGFNYASHQQSRRLRHPPS